MEFIDKNDFLNNCQSGDLILYNSNRWYSRLIEWGTGSKFSHIAMILRDPIFINPSLKGLYILESGFENIPDSLSNKQTFGVQLIPLEHVLGEYKDAYFGNLYYRQLKCQKNELFENKIKECVINTDGKKYDLNILDWFKSLLDLKIGDVHKTNTFWCSALIAYVYAQLGFLNKDIDWTLIEPKKFSYYEDGKLNYENCHLEPEKCILLN